VKATFSDPEQVLGLKWNESDLTKENCPEGDVNFCQEAREVTNWYLQSVASKSISRRVAFEGIEDALRRLHKKREAIGVSLRNKRS